MSLPPPPTLPPLLPRLPAPVIVSGATMRSAVTASLQASLPVVLPALERLSGVVLPQPVTWARVADFTRLPEEQSPAVYITTPGIDGRPRRVPGAHAFYVDFISRVYVVVNDDDYDLTSDRVSLYVAAIRTALLGDPSLGGLAEGCDFDTESEFEPLATEDQRSIGAGSTTIIYRRVLTAATINPVALAAPGTAPTATSIALNLAAAAAVDSPHVT